MPRGDDCEEPLRWDRLAHLIGAERGRRHWTVSDLAVRAAVSERTVEYMESGKRRRYRDSTIGRVEDAFGWKPGTVSRILDGNYVEASDSDAMLERLITRWPFLTSDERRAIVDLLETFTRRRH